MTENRIEDSDFEEITIEDTPERDPISFLPPGLKTRAKHLPPERAFTLLELSPPGSGHNASLLSVAGTCFKMGVSFDDTLDHLQAAYSHDRIDYETAPRRAVQRVWEAEGDLSKLVDGEAILAPDAKEEMLLRYPRTTSIELSHKSPGKLATPTREILNRLFNPGDIINIQLSALEHGTLVKLDELDDWLIQRKSALEDFKFLNPANFKKVEGVPNPLQNNKVSTRCNENVKARRWMVLEFDYESNDTTGEMKAERFTTFAMMLAKFAPLVLANDTGNKSIHFWFDASNVKPATRKAFFALACLHGSDPRLAVKSQIARMPNTPTAGEGRGPQRVLYFDPEGEKTPEIWDLTGLEEHIANNRQLDYYYNPGKSFPYLTRDNAGAWVELSRASLRLHLARQGYRIAAMEGEQLTPADNAILDIEMQRAIEEVIGNAAGRHSGFYEENGNRVIVRKSPHLIKPRKRDFPTIRSFLEGLLGHDPDGLGVFYGWVSDAVKKHRNGGKRISDMTAPAQMLHLAGDANAGKTLLTKCILIPILGGRWADASPMFRRYEAEHNQEMFGAELLVLDDSPVLETDYKFRQIFGERIKTHVVGAGGSGFRAMRKDRVLIKPFHRFIRLMNLEPATLATIPPLDDGIEDKLILLLGRPMQDGPLAGEMMLPRWFDKISARMAEELPGFIHYLIEEFQLSPHLKDPGQRYAVRSYKNADLIAMIADGSPEQYILHRIDNDCREALFGGLFTAGDGGELTDWRGSCDRLYDVFSQTGSRASQMRFQKVCPNPRVLLSLLRQLEKTAPERVAYSTRKEGIPDKLKGLQYWHLSHEKPPVEDPDGLGSDILELM